MSAKLKNIITMLTLVILILGISIGLSVVLKPIKERNLNRDVINKYQKVFDQKISNVTDKEMKDSDPKTVLEAKNVYVGNTVIASAYEAYKKNDFGSITILVSVDSTNKILGVVATVDQSFYPTETKKFIEGYKGKQINEFTATDGVSGATTSANTAAELMADVAIVHGTEPNVVIEKNVYELLIGDDYAFSNEVLIDEGDIKKSETVSGQLGSALVYYLEGIGLYQDGKEEKSYELQLIVNEYTTEIIGYYFDEEKYHHTPGFRGELENYLDMLILNNTSAVSFDALNEEIAIDGESGGSKPSGESFTPFNSVALAQRMLTELANYLQDIYTVEEKVAVEDEYVLSKRQVTINEEVLMIYEIIGTGVYFAGNPANSVISEVVVNAEGIIIDMKFIEYNHTPGGFKEPSDNYIKFLVREKTNINEIVAVEDLSLIDEESGATSSTGSFKPSNSVKIIHESLVGLSEYIKGGN